jgi:hypothetical protein
LSADFFDDDEVHKINIFLGLDAMGIPVTGRKIEVNPGILSGYWRDISEKNFVQHK